jgi:hypothetical protein
LLHPLTTRYTYKETKIIGSATSSNKDLTMSVKQSSTAPIKTKVEHAGKINAYLLEEFKGCWPRD